MTTEKGAAMTDAELPIHQVTGLHAVGMLDDGRPVWPVLGGAEDDDDDGDVGLDVAGGSSKGATDEDEDLDDDSGDDEGDAGKKTEAEWKPPSRDDFEKMLKALGEANGEAKKYRLQLRDFRRSQRTAEEKAERTGAADDDAVANARREATELAEAKFKPIAVRSAARAQFLEAGLNDTKVLPRLLKMLDMGDIDLDDDGDPIGLDEQIRDIKDDLPKLFETIEPEVPRQEKRRAPRITGANRETPAPAPKTTGEIHAARALAGE